MQRNACEVLVCVNGKPIREYGHEQKTFVEGRPGSQYSLKLKNNSGKRVIAVISVDGLNVITGDPEEGDGAGYIVDKYSSVDIKGFRHDMDSVGAFKFCEKSKSYCNSQKETKGNNGVIGVRFIDEQDYVTITSTPTYWGTSHNTVNVNSVMYKGCANDANDANDADEASFNTRSFNVGSDTFDYMEDTNLEYEAPRTQQRSIRTKSVKSKIEPQFSVGTTWGKKLEDKTRQETFNRGNLRAEIEFFYASKKDLKKMGVSFEKKPKVSFPSAFGKFAKPPKNWRG